MKRVHLDHNATTPLRSEVRAFWLEQVDALHGNPSSVHSAGRAARHVLDESRERVAAALGVHEDEVVFTSGGTESNNLALLGGLRIGTPKRALVTTAIEHSSVLGPASQLESEGHRVERIGVDAHGVSDLDHLARAACASDVGLVSAMAANNETGVLIDIEGLGRRLRELGPKRPLFHTDAVQALGRIPVKLQDWRPDLASFSAHKVGGPLGVGLLYKRKGVAITSLFFGGGQEGGLRPGTENVPAIAAASLAVELAVREQSEFAARTRELCNSFWRQVRSVIPGADIHGPPLDSPARLPNTLNLFLPGIDSRVLVARLDLEGLEVSAGSACASGSLEPSHVLLAMGLSPESARSGLRISLGRTTDIQDIHTAVDILRRTFVVHR